MISHLSLFIGRHGNVLKESDTCGFAFFEFKGDELFVRVELSDVKKNKAWTNPVLLNRIQFLILKALKFRGMFFFLFIQIHQIQFLK